MNLDPEAESELELSHLTDEDETSIGSIPVMSGTIPTNIEIHITTDNASNISRAVKDSGYTHIRCFAHTVNLAVQKGLSHIDPQLVKMRKVVTYIRRSSKATIALQVITLYVIVICMLKVKQ